MSSLSEWDALAIWRAGRKHGYLPKPFAHLVDVHEHHGEPNPSPWHEAAEEIISLLNLKDLAAKIPKVEGFTKSIDAQLASLIEAIALTPDPEAAPPSRHPFPHGPILWHWGGPIPPGPLRVIWELNLYAKLIPNEKFAAEIEATIAKIAEKAGAKA